MTSLIKSSSHDVDRAVRPFTGAVRIAPDVRPREALLEGRVAELEQELATLAQALPDELERARDEGARAALEARSRAEAEALDALSHALAQAHDAWRERLDAWDAAAAGLARAVLAQILGSAEQHAPLVLAALKVRLSQLDGASLVRIRVSAADFPDSGALLRAAARVGNGCTLEPDAGLATGECLVDLKLGHVEVSPGAQWGRVATLLEELECERLLA